MEEVGLVDRLGEQDGILADNSAESEEVLVLPILAGQVDGPTELLDVVHGVVADAFDQVHRVDKVLEPEAECFPLGTALLTLAQVGGELVNDAHDHTIAGDETTLVPLGDQVESVHKLHHEQIGILDAPLNLRSVVHAGEAVEDATDNSDVLFPGGVRDSRSGQKSSSSVPHTFYY